MPEPMKSDPMGNGLCTWKHDQHGMTQHVGTEQDGSRRQWSAASGGQLRDRASQSADAHMADTNDNNP